MLCLWILLVDMLLFGLLKVIGCCTERKEKGGEVDESSPNATLIIDRYPSINQLTNRLFIGLMMITLIHAVCSWVSERSNKNIFFQIIVLQNQWKKEKNRREEKLDVYCCNCISSKHIIDLDAMSSGLWNYIKYVIGRCGIRKLGFAKVETGK